MAGEGTGAVPAITPPSAECGTQTLVHLRDFGIDYTYEWNEWVLRRRALLLCNLRQCSSTSAQTHTSHFRREQDTQCWLPKDAEQQTPAYAAASMPRRVRCISRGLKVTKENTHIHTHVDNNIQPALRLWAGDRLGAGRAGQARSEGQASAERSDVTSARVRPSERNDTIFPAVRTHIRTSVSGAESPDDDLCRHEREARDIDKEARQASERVAAEPQ